MKLCMTGAKISICGNPVLSKNIWTLKIFITPSQCASWKTSIFAYIYSSCEKLKNLLICSHVPLVQHLANLPEMGQSNFGARRKCHVLLSYCAHYHCSGMCIMFKFLCLTQIEKNVWSHSGFFLSHYFYFLRQVIGPALTWHKSTVLFFLYSLLMQFSCFKFIYSFSFKHFVSFFFLFLLFMAFMHNGILFFVPPCTCSCFCLWLCHLYLKLLLCLC